MKFEYLIWIGILLIYVLSMVIKKAHVASKIGDNGTAKKLPGWREKLNTVVDQIQQMAEEGDSPEGNGPVNREMSWESIEPSLEKPPVFEKEPVEVKTDTAVTAPALAKSAAERIQPGKEKAKAVPMEPAAAGKEIPVLGLTFGVQDIRRAVIWSEILAPPLALRDR